jgi:bifunctional non-homologous end joining protein LigD
LAQGTEGELNYVGKVGTGFDDNSLKQVADELKKLEIIKRPIREKPVDDARSIWLRPKLLCEVQFASWTKEGALREPVFLRLRPDLTL